MNCEECKELIWDYLSNDLKTADASQVAAHLENCPECQKEAEEVRKIMDSFSSLPEVELPKGYHAELMDKLAEEKEVVRLFPVKTKKYIWKQFSVIAAGIVLVAVIGGTQGILKMRGGQEAPLQRMAAQGSIEAEDTTLDAPPQEEGNALPKQAMLEEVADTGEAEIQLKSAPQPNKANGVVEPKETVSPKETKVQAPIESKAEIQMKENVQPDINLQAEMTAEADQALERGFLFSADAQMSETQVQQQVILSVETAEGVLDRIRDLAISLGGYEEIRLSAESIRILVPTDQAEKFIEGLNEIGETRSMLENSEAMDMLPFEVTIEIN